MNMMNNPTTTQHHNPSIPMGMAMSNVSWRSNLTREYRTSLIRKLYEEMIRISNDPPGISLWMRVSFYELTIFTKSENQEDYVGKIISRLKLLEERSNSNLHNLRMADNMYQHTNGYMSVNNANQHYNHYNAMVGNGYAPQGEVGISMPMGGSQMNYDNPGFSNNINADAESRIYWTKHAALYAKYYSKVNLVNSAFVKYVAHLTAQGGNTEQKDKLEYLLGHITEVLKVLNEDPSRNVARPLSQLHQAEKYIIKIVIPYLKKLTAENNKKANSTDQTKDNFETLKREEPTIDLRNDPINSTVQRRNAHQIDNRLQQPNGHPNLTMGQSQLRLGESMGNELSSTVGSYDMNTTSSGALSIGNSDSMSSSYSSMFMGDEMASISMGYNIGGMDLPVNNRVDAEGSNNVKRTYVSGVL